MIALRKVFGLCFSVSLLCLGGVKVQAQEVQQELERGEMSPDSVLLAIEADTIAFQSSVEVDPIIEIGEGQISAELLRERFKELEKEVPLLYNEESHKYVEYFVYKKADFTRRMLENKDNFFPIFERLMKQHGIPEELKYLSLIESGLNPTILSRVGAGGLWQFMRPTGREFGLRQDQYVDERFHPEKSTEAACRYLKQLYRIFGDWEMALASYNCGPGNIRRAIRRTGQNTFWGIYNVLPKETRNYVPQFTAMVYLMKYAEDHGFKDIEKKRLATTDTIHINGYINLNTFASLSGITIDEIKEHNPHIINTYLPAHTKDFHLRIPLDKKRIWGDGLYAIIDSAARTMPVGVTLADGSGDYEIRKQTHIVKRGENLSSIANRYRVSVAQLRKWNRIGKGGLQKGQRIVIQQRVKIETQPNTDAIVSNTVQALAATAAATDSVNTSDSYIAKQIEAAEEVVEETVAYHTIKRGEHLDGIARKYNTDMATLRDMNGMSTNKLIAGKTLKVPSTTTSQIATKEGVDKQPMVAKEQANYREELRYHYHTIQRGENLDIIARKYKTSVSKLKGLNGTSSTKLIAGKKMKVGAETVRIAIAPKQSTTNVTLANASVKEVVKVQEEEERNVAVEQNLVAAVEAEESTEDMPSYAEEIKFVYHTIKKGENMAIIAKRYGTTVPKLMTLNGKSSNKLVAGDKLKVRKETVRVAVNKSSSKNTSAKVVKEKSDVVEPEVEKTTAPVILAKVESMPVSKVEYTTEEATYEHVIRKGESLDIIARKYKMSIDELKELNGLTSHKIGAGNTLLVKDNSKEQVSRSSNVKKEDTVEKKIAKPNYHVVQKGDTLWDISLRYGMSVDQIRKINNLKGNGLRLGMKILIGS